MKNIPNYLLLSAVLLWLFSCQKSTKTENVDAVAVAPRFESKDKGQAGVPAVEGEQQNALQLAKSLDDFSTLVSAIEKAGVENAVVNAGPLTIFAPLNSAFDKLPKGTLDDLIKPENQKKLSYILKNHVAPSNYPIKQLKKGRKLYMASGNYLTVENKDGKIIVGGTEILKSVKVSNGWVHVIDDVLVPSE